ncbi:flagellar basal body-associated FliL family protein [Marinobacter sp. CA1]|uniref:flagellar basal body-associated FliL family protein n=1 Tax=Marinobacter sp. CA1 TaxID=2817656 RepID=UPI001D06154A|nr:flagellar basal body-associated FliL family protein [Marinobacter sp. CA1]UDL06678.1 flagellar basal body-associated FliL family protein [Marinobacter sp. CA1]
MADDNAPDGAPKKGKLKTILLLVVVVILAVGLSVAGTLWFLQEKSDDGDDASNNGEPAQPAFQPSQYAEIEKALVTTVQAEGRQRYAQVYVAFEADNAAALAATELHMPLLRAQLINVLAASDFMTLQSAEGRQQLSQTMLDAVNGVLEQEGEPPLKRVLLRNFVLQ